MSRLRIINNLKILKEVDKVAIEASLVCDCGNECFYVSHTGKKTKGILSSWLIKNDKQISVMCKCKDCGKKIIVCDTTIDGLKPLDIEKSNYAEFAIKGKNIFKIILYYNYWEEDYMTNRFYDCFIHAILSLTLKENGAATKMATPFLFCIP